jgi:hypothetical protein
MRLASGYEWMGEALSEIAAVINACRSSPQPWSWQIVACGPDGCREEREVQQNYRQNSSHAWAHHRRPQRRCEAVTPNYEGTFTVTQLDQIFGCASSTRKWYTPARLISYWQLKLIGTAYLYATPGLSV